MHALRLHRRRLRRVVWLTTAAWCFALFSGVVNACLLTPAGAARIEEALHGEVVHAAAQALPVGYAVPDGHSGHGALPHVEHGAGTQSCLKFCDDGSTALSKTAGSAIDPGVPIGVAIAAWNSTFADSSSASRPWWGGSAATGPPLVIRFLRLTL
jgi:hypothetical protein